MAWAMRRIAVLDTVDGIRAALPEDQRARFEEELGRATAESIGDVVRHWVLNLASDAQDEDAFARLEAENRGCRMSRYKIAYAPMAEATLKQYAGRMVPPP